MLAVEIEPAVPVVGRRRSLREPVSLDARIGRGGLERALCRIVDLSLHGARLQTYSALKRGATFWLTLPALGPRAAGQALALAAVPALIRCLVRRILK